MPFFILRQKNQKKLKTLSVVFLTFFCFGNINLVIATQENIASPNQPKDNQETNQELTQHNDNPEKVTQENQEPEKNTEKKLETENIDSEELNPLNSVDQNQDSSYLPEKEAIENKLNLKADLKTGALTYSFPITISPGRNNLQPSLNLTYNSQNKKINNLFGYGWQTDIPYIERQNKKGIEKMYTENNFYSSISGELNKL